jgi:PAS domain-containing protein
VGIEPSLDISRFAEFAEALQGEGARSERVVRQALDRVGTHSPPTLGDELTAVSRELDGAFRTIDSAAEELRVQNEALFAARVELEGTSALFRELFELAPTPYLVTDIETRIAYANDAACALLRCPKNALVRKPLACFVSLDERMPFRAAVLRTRESSTVCTWPTALLPRGAEKPLDCRMRVRPVAASGAQPPLALYWNITEETDEDLF